MSPHRDGHWERIECAPPLERQGRHQRHWYEFMTDLVCGKTVLDVGAGDGSGAQVMRRSAMRVYAIDPAPVGEGVSNASLSTFADRAVDVVTAMDVIEHVEDDVAFLSELLRVSSGLVFFSTPNWNVSKCKNRYHVREYTPEELRALVTQAAGPARVEWYSSDAQRRIERLAPEQVAENFGVLIHGVGACAR